MSLRPVVRPDRAVDPAVDPAVGAPDPAVDPAAVPPDPADAGYLPALDGLRAVSILGVLVSHAGVRRLLGAAQGVTVFFVISGFLITMLLLKEHRRTGGIRLAGFYRRRFARLMPAFLLAIGVTTAYLLLDGHPWSAFWQGPVLSCLYVINFAGAGQWLTPLARDYYVHNWSLAIEEQFYLVWPAVLALTAGRRRGRHWLALVCLLAAATAQTIRLVESGRHTPFDQANFATVTRMDALMLGALMALAVGRPDVRALLARWAAPLQALSVLVLAVVVVQGAIVRLDPGGYLAAGVASAVLVGCLSVRPAGRLARVLSTPVACWGGRISYSLYLWNVLLLQIFLSAVGHRPAHSLWGPLWVIACFAAAEASYRFVEVPLRRRLGGRSARHRARAVRPAEAARVMSA